MATKQKIRSAYDGSRVPVTTDTGKSDLVQQHQKEQCDINAILKKYNKTGVIQHVKEHEGKFGDFTGMDYQQMMQQCRSAEEVFMSLPAQERKKFNNDVAEYLDHIQNPDNWEDMKDGSIDNKPSLDGEADLQSDAPIEEPSAGQ
jgi:phage internal scaffolding protein